MLAAPFWQTKQNILFYWPFSSEINLLPSLQTLLDKGHQCFLPICTPQNIAFAQLINLNAANLQKGFYGNLEPNSPRQEDFSQLDIFLVPGLAFDQVGYRLGRGLGFYDRILSLKNPKAISIGISGEELIWPRLAYLEPWDQKVDYLLSQGCLREVN